MSVEEFQGGEWDDSTGTKRFLTCTLRHKTSASGSGTLFWDEQSHGMARFGCRTSVQVASHVSTFPSSSGNKDPGVPFFVNSTGSCMSGNQVSRRIVDMAQYFCRGLKVTLSGARVRKSVVSTHRKTSDPNVTSAMLTKQMLHSETTADAHYDVNKNTKQLAAVVEFIKTNIHQTKHPSICTIVRPNPVLSTVNPSATQLLSLATTIPPPPRRRVLYHSSPLRP